VAGTQKQMIGVGEDYFGIEIVEEVAWGKTLDGALGTDGHEDRRFDCAVRRVKQAGPGARVWTNGLNFKAEGVRASLLGESQECMVA
jgi:hypothetical protein